MAQTSRPCKGCGHPIYRTSPTSSIKHYHGPECRPRCSIEGCDKPIHTRGMCSAHATRDTRYGDPLAPLLRQKNSGLCGVDGCDRPMRKVGLCASHYQQARVTKAPKPFRYTWSDEPNCLICGERNGKFKSRKFCSAACQRMFARHGLERANPNCARCGVEVDLSERGKGGKRRRTDTKLCRKCKAQTRTEATPGELALRDGPHCQLCGCDVDLAARAPDPMRASVDHIVPRAWGGSDAAENNQLTHLLCNQIKSDRLSGLSRRSVS